MLLVRCTLSSSVYSTRYGHSPHWAESNGHPLSQTENRIVHNRHNGTGRLIPRAFTIYNPTKHREAFYKLVTTAEHNNGTGKGGGQNEYNMNSMEPIWEGKEQEDFFRCKGIEGMVITPWIFKWTTVANAGSEIWKTNFWYWTKLVHQVTGNLALLLTL